MKKIFTLLLSAGLFTACHAQGHYGGHDGYGKAGNYTATINGSYAHQNQNYRYVNQKKIKLERINREYNTMVISIQNNRYMSRHQKRLAFRDAQKQRDRQIERLNREYTGYAYGYKDYGRR